MCERYARNRERSLDLSTLLIKRAQTISTDRNYHRRVDQHMSSWRGRTNEHRYVYRSKCRPNCSNRAPHSQRMMTRYRGNSISENNVRQGVQYTF